VFLHTLTNVRWIEEEGEEEEQEEQEEVVNNSRMYWTRCISQIGATIQLL
jgi:hypothetical protein